MRAVLGSGDATACVTQPPVIGIFDARTGARLKVLDPTRMLNALGYTGDLGDDTWAPDGASIVFESSVKPLPVTPGRDKLPGLLWLPAVGGSPRIMLASVGTLASLAGAGLDGSSIVWNIRTGMPASLIGPQKPGALTYRWTPSGQIVADQPLPTTLTPLTGAPASPPGGTTFSRWQPGTLNPIYSASSDGGFNTFSPPIAEVYQANTTIWSPDHQYVTFGLPILAVLPSASGRSLPAISQQECTETGIGRQCLAAAAPFPDFAFVAISSASERGAHQNLPDGSVRLSWGSVPVTWRPDGHVVATILPDDGPQSGNSTLTISLFKDDEAVRTTALYTVCSPRCSGPISGGGSVLRWSPTGLQLSFFDYNADLLIIWGAGSLPA